MHLLDAHTDEPSTSRSGMRPISLLMIFHFEQGSSKSINRQCEAVRQTISAAVQGRVALHVREVQKAAGSLGQAILMRHGFHGRLASLASLSQGPAQNSR